MWMSAGEIRTAIVCFIAINNSIVLLYQDCFMPITHHQEDILPNIAYGQGSSPESASLTVHAGQVKAQSISGCLSLIGPVKLCYDIDISVPSVSACLEVAGVKVVCGELSPAHPCLHVSGNYGVAKWDLNLCIDIAKKQLTLKGKACVMFLGCKSFDVVVFSW